VLVKRFCKSKLALPRTRQLYPLDIGDGPVDSFEAVIAAVLQRQGFWTLTSAKVELTKEEKREIGRYSSPRWELDIVAYRGGDNHLRVVECKSYLDSPGVDCAAFNGSNKKAQDRYKLFFDHTLRNVVFRRLEHQLVNGRFCRKNPKIQLCLAAGKVKGDEMWLASHFKEKGWLLLGPAYIRTELSKLKDAGYENSVAAVVTKLLLRGSAANSASKGVDADV
jgi:hypothetical protein